MRACILTGGTLGDISRVAGRLPRPDYVICADDGLSHAGALGFSPDKVVGDFDSVSPSLLSQYEGKGTAFEKYPSRKDKTDTQIAVDEALNIGADEIWIVAGAGTRLDHSYANLMLLSGIAESGRKAFLLNQYNLIFPILQEAEIAGEPGQVVSFLPFGGDVRVISSEGLSYPLDGLSLTMTDPVGVSNVMVSDKAFVRIGTGRLLCMLAWDE
jgi:thiamine pyrophosphokinase